MPRYGRKLKFGPSVMEQIFMWNINVALHSSALAINIPSKFLNVYEFGMKKYSSQPIAALLERKAEL